MIIRSISDFRLQYDEPLSLLRLEWLSGTDTSTLRASAGQLLLLARQRAVRNLLLNMNTVPNISAEDELWLGTNWLPGMVELPLERVVLVIASDQTHNQLAIDSLHDLVQPAIHFDVQYFTDSDSALHWMTDNSARLPALLAEWDAQAAATAAGSEATAPPPPRLQLPSLLAWPQPGPLAPFIKAKDTPGEA